MLTARPDGGEEVRPIARVSEPSAAPPGTGALAPPTTPGERRATALAAGAAAFLTPFIGSASQVALPEMGRELHLDAILLSWVPTAYLLAVTATVIPFGRLADITGRKRVFVIGLLLYTACALLTAVAFSGPVLLLARVLQGIASAMISATTTAILTSVYPPQERGKALGLNVMGTYLGLSVGPVVGGLLTEYVGWRAIFLLTVPLGLGAALLVTTRLRAEWVGAPRARFDHVGAALYAGMLLALMGATSLLPAPTGWLLIGLGVVFGLVFVRWESRAPSPVLDLNLFRHNTVFAFSSLATLVLYSSTVARSFLLTLYLRYVMGLSAELTGLLFVTEPVVMAALSPLAGRLSDRYEPRVVATAGLALTVPCTLLLGLVDEQTPLWVIPVLLAVLGTGFALFSSPNMNAVMSAVEPRQYGVASATIGMMRASGQMFGMGVAMVALAVNVGPVPLATASHALILVSMKAALVVFAVLCAGGIAASLARGKVH